MDERTREQLRAFLAEDATGRDVTTRAVVPAEARATATVTAVQAGTIAGLREATVLAELCDVAIETLVEDGDQVAAGTTLLQLRGSAHGILGLERTLLNLLSHLSGIATTTRAATLRIEGTGARVAATRKTLPGLRDLEKRAVVLGGGDPHRRDLADAVLIKENHLAFAGSVVEAVRRARAARGEHERIEIEVETSADALAAAEAGADIVMLDNMSPDEVREVVALLRRHGLRERVEIESSGGITPDNAAAYAAAGADVISMGALTMSAPALDINLAISAVP